MAAQDLLSWFSIFTFDISVARPECMSPAMMKPFNRYLVRLSLPLFIALLLAVFLLYEHAHDLWVRTFSHRFRSSWAPRLTRWADEVRFAQLLGQLQLGELGESADAAQRLCDVSSELVELWVALHTQVGGHARSRRTEGWRHALAPPRTKPPPLTPQSMLTPQSPAACPASVRLAPRSMRLCDFASCV